MGSQTHPPSSRTSEPGVGAVGRRGDVDVGGAGGGVGASAAATTASGRSTPQSVLDSITKALQSGSDVHDAAAAAAAVGGSGSGSGSGSRLFSVQRTSYSRTHGTAAVNTSTAASPRSHDPPVFLSGVSPPRTAAGGRQVGAGAAGGAAAVAAGAGGVPSASPAYSTRYYATPASAGAAASFRGGGGGGGGGGYVGDSGRLQPPASPTVHDASYRAGIDAAA